MILCHKKAHISVFLPFGGKRGAVEIKKELAGIPGVKSVAVNSSVNRVSVDYDSTGISCSELKNAMDKIGFDSEIIQNYNHGFD